MGMRRLPHISGIEVLAWNLFMRILMNECLGYDVTSLPCTTITYIKKDKSGVDARSGGGEFVHKTVLWWWWWHAYNRGCPVVVDVWEDVTTLHVEVDDVWDLNDFSCFLPSNDFSYSLFFSLLPSKAILDMSIPSVTVYDLQVGLGQLVDPTGNLNFDEGTHGITLSMFTEDGIKRNPIALSVMHHM